MDFLDNALDVGSMMKSVDKVGVAVMNSFKANMPGGEDRKGHGTRSLKGGSGFPQLVGDRG